MSLQGQKGEPTMKLLAPLVIAACILLPACTNKGGEKPEEIKPSAPAAGVFAIPDSQSKKPITVDNNLASQPFRGNVKRKVLHGPGCIHYRCQNCTAIFSSIAQAKAKGYRLHRCIR